MDYLSTSFSCQLTVDALENDDEKGTGQQSHVTILVWVVVQYVIFGAIAW